MSIYPPESILEEEQIEDEREEVVCENPETD
jgi:hypothetical protein